jgi:signal transduction histidine kinase/CheY-like chemotaxis protein
VSKDVLLIEDDPLYREMLLRRLVPDGYEFFEAESPTEGIRILEANPDIRVILLDLSFQDHAGTEMLDHISERSDYYRVIVLTAHDEMLAAERAREYDVFNYLPKEERSSHQALRFSLDQAFKDLERATLARKIEFLLAVQWRITENRDTKEILDLICKSVRKIVGAYTCHIRVYDFTRGDFHLVGFDPDGPLRDVFSVPRAKGELFSGRVAETGQPEEFHDLQKDQRFLQFKQSAVSGRSMSPEEAHYWENVSSVYIVPISTGLFGNTVDAVLNVSSQAVGFFDADKRALIDEFVQQASLAITKDWLQQKRKELHEDYSRISGILGEMRDRLSKPDALHTLYQTVTQKLSELVHAEVVSIFMYSEQTGRIRNVSEYRGTRHVDASEEEYEVGKSFVGYVFQTSGTLQLQSSFGVRPVDDPRFDHTTTEHYADIIPSGTLEHYLGVPIRVGGQILGVLRAMNKKSVYYDERIRNGEGTVCDGAASQPTNRFCLLERGFSIDCKHIVEITASHLAIAIQNARLLKERTQRLEQLQTLGEVGRIISSELDIQSVLEQTMHAMAIVMQAEICMLFLKDDEGRVVLKHCYGIPDAEILGASYEVGEGLIGSVAATGEARLIQKTGYNHGKYDVQIRSYLTMKKGRLREIESLMVVPIIAKDTPLGVMKVINKLGDDPQYQESDLDLFRTFGRYVGVAIENAQIYELTSQQLDLAEQDAALSDLVRAVAHEINNTSGLIPANVDAIRKRLGPASANVSEMLDLIDDVANQATEFANEITGFSATRRGERRVLDVNAVIQSALREFDRERYVADLTISMAKHPLVCFVYETPFKQIIRNIALNAFQALEKSEHGVVAVSTSRGAGRLASSAIIQVSDNGPGIRSEHVNRIFESDFSTKPTGNGIGLWLVRKQLELIGGTIKVESELGAGAQFTVTIPLASLPDAESLE